MATGRRAKGEIGETLVLNINVNWLQYKSTTTLGIYSFQHVLILNKHLRHCITPLRLVAANNFCYYILETECIVVICFVSCRKAGRCCLHFLCVYVHVCDSMCVSLHAAFRSVDEVVAVKAGTGAAN